MQTISTSGLLVKDGSHPVSLEEGYNYQDLPRKENKL